MPPDATRLDAALAIAARLVARDGAAYLPIFLRPEAARKDLQGEDDALARAMAMAMVRCLPNRLDRTGT